MRRRGDKIFREVEQDENVIDRIAVAQREELERKITGLQVETRAKEEGKTGARRSLDGLRRDATATAAVNNWQS